MFDTLVVIITESLVPTIMDKFLWDTCFYLSPVQSNLDYSDFFFGSNFFTLIELTKIPGTDSFLVKVSKNPISLRNLLSSMAYESLTAKIASDKRLHKALYA